MKIAIPTVDGKLCAHFGHCESFTFAEIDETTKEIKTIEERIPEEGISCQSAAWIAEQGAQIVLAGGMGGRPLQMFANCGVNVITGCPEEDIEEVVTQFLTSTLETGENACGGEHHHCQGHHQEHHHCHEHNHEHHHRHGEGHCHRHSKNHCH